MLCEFRDGRYVLYLNCREVGACVVAKTCLIEIYIDTEIKYFSF